MNKKMENTNINKQVKHEPVMLKEALENLNIQPNKITESNSDTILVQENPRKPIYG